MLFGGLKRYYLGDERIQIRVAEKCWDEVIHDLPFEHTIPIYQFISMRDEVEEGLIYSISFVDRHFGRVGWWSRK